MRVEDNCIVGINVNDKNVDCADGDYEIEGTTVEGETKIGNIPINILGGIPIDEALHIWIPENGILYPHEIPDDMIDTYIVDLPYQLIDWLQTRGKIDKICFESTNKIIASLDRKTFLVFRAQSPYPTIRIEYNGKSIFAAFKTKEDQFIEVSPFVESPARYIRVTYRSESIVPAVKTSVFDIEKLLSASEAIKIFDKYDGQNWPQTNIPIIFKDPENAKLVINKNGIFYVDNEEIKSTIFVPPVQPTKYIVGPIGTTYYFGKFALFVKYKPSISDFTTYILATEFLADVGDVATEFNTI